MEKDLGDYRKSYDKQALEETQISDNPMQLFQTWFYEVEASETVDETNAMSISSIGLDGFPKTRVVLLKKYYEEGFIFYTNYDSEKGRAIAAHPEVCLSFFWPSMERQVIIKGLAERLPGEVSDNYFDSRPLGSRLGAMVSPQSKVIDSRAVLEDSLKALEAQAVNGQVKRPSHWGGYLVRPKSIEFWQGRPNRLHDRIRYSLEKDFNWTVERLAP
ncbi:MAG: pyridoxamine 5'-phosphate oxidase [Bacteroidetes bacterium]|nr:pyridoxamine 5'-phosphate oxidase [Bacteroidota bacterium]MDA1144340.1 pyridoxamine 5'-phosphate oxidase [Bacteroidota bacterium]